MNEFEISKELIYKLKNKSEILADLLSGQIPQNIYGYSDETMKKFYQAAHRFLEQKKYSESLDAFVFLVTMRPCDYAYWIGLGSALQSCKEYESAIDAYELAATYDLENPWAYFYLANCLFAIHDRTSALQAIELALDYADRNEAFSEVKTKALHAKKMLLQDST